MLQCVFDSTQAMIDAPYPALTGGDGAALAYGRGADAGSDQHCSEGEPW